jgi:two-component system chemotaxis sensor kinase CheA
VSSEAAVLPSNTDLELLKEYIVECLDHITGAEAALLTLETDPSQSEPIHTVFRAFHTIKGTSGFLNLEHIQKLAHRAENLLDRARNGEIRLTGGYADLALESCDALKAMIKGLEGLRPGMELPMPANCEGLLEKLADPAAAGITADGTQPPVIPRLGDILVAQGSVSRQVVETVAAEQGSSRIGEALVQSGAASATDVAQAIRAQKQTAVNFTSDAMVRVSTDRLDSLINMIGELVISQSMIAQDPIVLRGRDAHLCRNVSQTGKIVRELQDLTMGMRMVPLKQTFQKMARLVRDLGRKSGKTVQLVTEGEDTEIDRNMVEVLNDPLVHMIRNSVDHGIEPAEVRAKAGKPGTGTVSLRAYHSAGSVVIEIKDDGKGLDHQRICAKAIERGLIDPNRELTESEAFGLIFLPGFSTAEKITDVSGRGVGMDVVRKNVESLRGRVDVASRPGLGSTFTLRLPLTMAITDAMQVRVGSERYLLPTVVIEQSFHPAPGTITTVTGRGECVMLRNELIPIVRLHRVFGVPGAGADPYGALLVAVEAEGERCALMVDELLSQQQVVVKSLGRSLGNVPGVSGGAILGTGRVGLILDVAGLIRLAREEVFPSSPESPDAASREEAGVLCAAR